ncbi:MAG: HAD family hydrolase, partial [Actinomycetota bacterium]|nr:HAD family hydrolase [Actinomycetota bacterium]
GVNSARDAVGAVAEQRPTYIGHDLRAVHLDADGLAIGPQPQWQISVDGTTLTVAAAQPEEDDSDGLSIVRAVAAAVAEADLAGRPFTVESADDTAGQALQHWCLLGTWP